MRAATAYFIFRNQAIWVTGKESYMRRKRWAGFAAVLLTAILLITGATPAVADNSRWGANYFPNVVLTTQDGTKVHFYDDLLKGKSVVIDMIYTDRKSTRLNSSH